MDENEFYMTTKEMVITIIAFVAAVALIVGCVAFIANTLA